MKNLKAPKIGWKMYWVEFLCVFIAIAVPILSYSIPSSETDQQWLARSGSIMVLAALVGEFNLQKKNVIKYLNNALRIKDGTQPLDYSNMAKVANVALLVCATLGTVIWGYGDLL